MSPPTGWARRRRVVLVVGGVLAAVGALRLTLLLLDRYGGFSFETPYEPIVLGVIIGLAYGVLAVGLVLIYRTSKIINFAHGQIGAFAAALFALVVVKYQLPYWLVLPFALLAGAGIAASAEAVVVRRLRNVPRLMSVVATLGVGQALLLAGAAINPAGFSVSEESLNYFPVPPLPSLQIGSLHVAPSSTGMLLLVPIAVLAIAAFLRWSRFGLALRASSANPEAARMAGIFAGRMSGLAWAIAGALSALSAILTQAASAINTGESFGPNLLLRAVAGAVLARMTSLPVALLAGIGIGIAEQLLLWNYPRGGVVELALLAVILLTLLVGRRRTGRDEEKGSWAAVEALRPVPEAVRRIWLVRNLGRVFAAITLVPLVVLPWVMSDSTADRVNAIIAFAIVGLAVGMLTGLSGQLTLGQFAVAGVGAVTSYLVSTATQNFLLGLLGAGLSAAAVSVLLGLPALRMRGLMLTVTTLAFALAAPTLFTELLGDRAVLSGRPVLPGGEELDRSTEYYWYALTIFLVALWLAYNVRRSGLGRLLVAVRDNEEGARAFTVRPWQVKLRGYLFAGFIAGLGGAVLGHSLMFLSGSAFPAKASIDVVVMTVIGGAGVLAGPIIGAALVIGVPAFVPLDAAGLAATQIGLLVLILYLPGGVAQLIAIARGNLILLIARARGIDLEAALPDADAAAADPEAASAVPAAASTTVPADWVAAVGTRPAESGDSPLLDARSLHKRFGGVQAVDGVSIVVDAGETVGLIGPNGAGKTTTFELLSGFTRPDTGRVFFDGADVSALGPERRGRLGLIRSFQDAALFPTLMVTECVMVALERTRPTSSLSAVTGWTSGERTKERQAREIISFMGLERYRDARIHELSTGTRRIAELACMVALRPRLLLLDEPTSGIAQRETEALGQLLGELKAQLGLTLLIIEHNIPLVMGISDRVIAMANGRVLKTGTPVEVSADPAVADAYLGRDKPGSGVPASDAAPKEV